MAFILALLLQASPVPTDTEARIDAQEDRWTAITARVHAQSAMEVCVTTQSKRIAADGKISHLSIPYAAFLECDNETQRFRAATFASITDNKAALKWIYDTEEAVRRNATAPLLP